MLRCNSWSTLLDDDHRPTNPSSIGSEVDDPLMVVDIDGYELRGPASSTQLSERSNELPSEMRKTDQGTIDLHKVDTRSIQLIPCDERDIFDSKHESDLDERFLRHIRRDMRHQRQILHQAACFPFRRIGRTKHPPLTGLKSSRAGNLSCLLELTRYPGHHAKCGDEAESGQDMGDTGSLDVKTFKRPVPGRDGSSESGSDGVSALSNKRAGVERSGSTLLLEYLIHAFL